MGTAKKCNSTQDHTGVKSIEPDEQLLLSIKLSLFNLIFFLFRIDRWSLKSLFEAINNVLERHAEGRTNCISNTCVQCTWEWELVTVKSQQTTRNTEKKMDIDTGPPLTVLWVTPGTLF